MNKQIKRSVKYNNDLHKAAFPAWTLVDHDVLFSVLSCIKNQGTGVVNLDVKDLREIVGFKTRGLQNWIKQLKETGNKILSLRYQEDKGKGFTIMLLFTMFRVSPDGKVLQVALSEHWEYILNNLGSNFTRYDLPEFLSIRSVYSKTMYRLLKQWRSLGYRKFSIEEFRIQLDIPDSYSSNSIQDRVIKQIKKDLPNYFLDFTVETVRSSSQGRKVIGYIFRWTPEAREEFNSQKYLNNGDPNNYSNSVLKEYNFSPNHSRKYTKVGEMNYLKLDNFKDTKSSRNRYDLSHWADENGEVVVFETWEGSLLREERRYDDDHVEKIFPKNIKINIPEDILKELKAYAPEEIQIISNDPEGEALIKELIEEGFFDE